MDKKEKILTLFNDVKQIISGMGQTKSEIAFFDIIFYSTLTNTYELFYNFKDLYKEEDLKGLRHEFYINYLTKRKLNEFTSRKLESYKLNIEADAIDYGNLSSIETKDDEDIDSGNNTAVYYHELKEIFQQKPGSEDYPDERKKYFFKNTPFPSIKLIEGYYFADQDNYFVFVFAIGFRQRLRDAANLIISTELRRKEGKTILLIQNYFTENIIRNLVERKEADLIREIRTTTFMHSLKTFNLQLSKSLFSEEKSIERLKGKVLSNYIAINIEWFETSDKEQMQVADNINYFDFGLFLENIFIQVYLLVFKDAQNLLSDYREKVVDELKKIGGLTATLKSESPDLAFEHIKKFFLKTEETKELLQIIESTKTISFYNEVKNWPASTRIDLSFSSKKIFFIEMYLQFFEFFHNAIKHSDKAIHYYYATDAWGNGYILFSSKKISVSVTNSPFVDKIIESHNVNNKDNLKFAQEKGHYGLILLTKFFARNDCEFSRFKWGKDDNMNFIRCIKLGAQTKLFSTYAAL